MLVCGSVAFLDPSQRTQALCTTYRIGGATSSAELQIAEQTVHSPRPVGAVGLVGHAVRLQDIAHLPAGTDDLEGDAARGEFRMEVAQHLCAGEIDEGRRR